MNLEDKIKEALISASIGISKNKLNALEIALNNETDANAIWALELMIDNIKIANKEKRPLCDDTGIPHILIETNNTSNISHNIISSINKGIKNGLKELPGRPMGVKGNSIERIEQTAGLYDDPSMVEQAPILLNINENMEDTMKIHIVMLGGGPEIRAKTYRIFHKHSYKNVLDETLRWLKDSLKMLGCTPSIPCIGIGRTHFEANSLMIKAMVHGDILNQSKIEKYMTNKLNELNIGPMGLGGKNTVLASFINIGPQRASGVRIVSARPSCFVEPRVGTVILSQQEVD